MSPIAPLPPTIASVDVLLSNLWWTWNHDARALLRSVDPQAFDNARGSGEAFRTAVSPGRWHDLAEDADFRTRLRAVSDELQRYLDGEDTWWQRNHAGKLPGGVAYFSAEFGIHEGLPIYSGGLGVLSGDHVKSASDLGIPLVAVGLFYRDGYFEQGIGGDGQQWEDYRSVTPAEVGLRRAIGAGGQPMTVYVPLYDRYVRCKVWQAEVGRVTLYLLDTDVHGNHDDDRWLTRRLYGGDQRNRICQEVVLGIGGLRALRAAGHRPDVMHLNEGHTSFVVLERYREELERGLSPTAAWKAVKTSTVFTTHTPVAAGHDRFWGNLVDNVLGQFREQLHMPPSELMDTGRVKIGDPDESLCMTVLALKGSRTANGVARRHGEVSRAMWQQMWPSRGVDEVPIGHITNGVHAPSWLGPEMSDLLAQHLGSEWRRGLASGERLEGVESIPDAEFWAAHMAQKRRLLDFVRRNTGSRMDPEGLLMGFARRFAPYKRGDLLLRDAERVKRLLTGGDRPVYLLYGGKSHPRDKPGKDIIAHVIRHARSPELGGHIAFLENYDIGVGRVLTQGVDVWINNPRRPLEASGTSGQKVSMNGGLNCSTLDGWWIEGVELEPAAGWGVGDPHVTQDIAQGDIDDAEALYQALENEVTALFNRRDTSGLPGAWIAQMKKTVAACLPAFNTDRMLSDYVSKSYLG